MQPPPQEARPRHRSAFAASFLSLIFPGLGHAYAGAYNRALGFAAIPILVLALIGGIALSSGLIAVGAQIVANLPLILIANLLFLAYRIAAAIDAYRVAAYLNAVEASGGGRFGRPSLRLQPLSVAGLLAVCLVIAGGHGVVAYYGASFQDTFSCIFDDPTGTACTEPTDAPATGDATLQPGDSPTAPATSAPPLGTPLPTAALPQWNGKDRLNILLIGADQRPKEGTFNTDTLIVVSIDPTTKQVAMFSLPRDTVDVPIPAGVQHMTGSQALIYARSRHTSSDFDRAQRQQRVILSIRDQADPRTVLDNLTQLLTDLKTSFRTDIPQDKLDDLIGLSSEVDSSNIRSFVLAPPRFAANATDQRGSIVVPNVSAIRQAVATAFKKVDPKIQEQREAVAGEDGFIWVINGSGKVGQASSIAAYLEYLGLTASAPTKRPDATVQQTRIRVYNGRESGLLATIALLENVFDVKATYLTDPSVTVDIIVTTGTRTPNLTPPPAP